MKKYLFLLVVAFGLTIAHAQVVPKNKSKSNAELKSASDNIDTMPALVRGIVMLKDSAFIYNKGSMVTSVPSKDWPLIQGTNKIPAKSNLSKVSSVNQEAVGPALGRAVQLNDSVFIYERETLVKRMPAKEWLNNESGNARAKGSAAAEKNNNQPEFAIAMKKNDSVYVFRNGTLLMKAADTSKTYNRNIRAAVNDVPIPVLLQHK